MLQRLRRMFQEAMDARREDKRRKERLADVLAAIEKEDATAVDAVLNDVVFNKAQSQEIVAATIEQDCLPVFDVVFGDIIRSDHNYFIHYSMVTTGGPGFHSVTPILSYAIENNSPNIALKLARDERTDITCAGKTTRYGTKNGDATVTEREHPTALELAMDSEDMKDVAVVLMRRLADIKMRESVTLREGADRYQAGERPPCFSQN